METPLLREDVGGITILTLNNPSRMNPLSNAMLDALLMTFEELAREARVKVVILRAEGRAFCAGHDLREMTEARAAADGGAFAFADLFEKCAQVMLAITRFPRPVIAEVQGMATAAGCQLVATCDLAVASESARFGVNGVNIGLFCSTPMVALTRNIPRKKALELLLTGDFLEAPEALALGLVNKVVPPDQLSAETLAVAEKIAGKLGPVVSIGKRAFYEQAEMTLEAAYAHTGRIMAENMMRSDTAEGIAAFLEKRRPTWSE